MIDRRSPINCIQLIIRMDWFCGCGSKQDKDVIQVYTPIDDMGKVYPKTSKEVSIARATPKQVLQNKKKEALRVKPLKELELATSQEGYVNIKEMRGKSTITNVFRKIKKSNYDKLYAQYMASNKNWIDPEFNHEIEGEIVAWKRLKDIIPNTTFMKYEMNPNQILQGRINDCYFISSVASLAERDYRIKNIFGSLQITPCGIYMCKLTYNGVYQEVIVDDYFPVNKEGKLLYAKPFNDTDCWMLILQKCWAKIFRSYSKINWGFPFQALCVLTAAPVRQFQIRAFSGQSDSSQFLFNKMVEHFSVSTHVLTCTLQPKESMYYYLNLQIGHAYSILGVFKTKLNDQTIRLVQIRNPVGGFKAGPHLAYSSKDKFWSKLKEQERSRLQFWMIDQPENGIFYVEWSQFIVIFDQVDICYLNDNAHYIYEAVKVKNQKPKYIELKIDEPTSFYLIVTQDEKRRFTKDPKDVKYASISVLVARNNYNYANKKTYEYITSQSQGYEQYQFQNSFPINLKLKIGGTYTIRIEANNEINNQTNLTVGYYSPDDFAVKFIDGIDDNLFLDRTLLNRANQLEQKQQPLNNADGWFCIQNILGSHLCYIAYHIDSSSKYTKYRIKIDETKNPCGLIFLGHEKGLKAFEQEVEKGREVIFIYTYSLAQLDDPQVLPAQQDTKILPNPIFQPIDS